MVKSKSFLPHSRVEANHTPNKWIDGEALLRMVLRPFQHQMGSREEACSGEGMERLLRDFPGPPWNRSSKETLLFNVSENHIPNQVQIHILNPRFWNSKSYEKGKVSLSLEQIQLVEKSDQNWYESIYNLHLSRPVWFFYMFHCRNMKMFHYKLFEMPLGMLSNIQFMYHITFLKFENFCNS